MDDIVEVGTRVSKNTIIGNCILAIFKITAGIVATSNAMIADGIHSLSDVITTIGVIIGIKLSDKPADKGHPYGHEKIENIATLFLGVMLMAVAAEIAYSGIRSTVIGDVKIPGLLALIMAGVSIVVKEWMYHYTMKYAKKINSSSLKADAWHHRSDSISSIGALIGIVGARNGFPVLDSLVGVVIAVIIAKVAFDIMKESIGVLIDSSASDEIVDQFENKIKGVSGIIKIDSIKTRKYASRLYVDVEVTVDASLTVEKGHQIAEKVHDTIEENKAVKHCMVHVNPGVIKLSN